jgi:sigma-E factor negative regulatory protein RseA
MNNAYTEASVQEQLSAMADGELDMEGVSSLVQASRLDASLMQTWASYHAIGQALRGHASDAASAQEGSVASAMHRGSMPLVTAMSSAEMPAFTAMPVDIAPVASVGLAQEAANESVFRWKLVAGVAAFAAVGTMMWALVGAQGNPTGAQLAQRTVPAPAALASATTPVPSAVESAPLESAPVMIRDPRLDELLAAHKQFGGASALQQPAGFLRNATFQSSGR